jgi:phospholipid/cholesterol/gamma-HCH transport system substrate-binding protein
MTIDTKSPIGVLLNDEKTANNIKETINNLERSSTKLVQNMEAFKHNFFSGGISRTKRKSKKKRRSKIK